MSKKSYYFIQISIAFLVMVTFQSFTYPVLFQNKSIFGRMLPSQNTFSLPYDNKEMWAALVTPQLSAANQFVSDDKGLPDSVAIV